MDVQKYWVLEAEMVSQKKKKISIELIKEVYSIVKKKKKKTRCKSVSIDLAEHTNLAYYICILCFTYQEKES